MEIISVAIVSSDEAYNKALSVAFANACMQISATIFDSREFIRNWAEYTGRGAYYDTFDIILWAGDEIRDSFGDNIVFLADKQSMIVKDYEENKFALYRYSPVHSIISSVYDIYSHLTGRTTYCCYSGDVRLFAFASCTGGIGCTSVTMSVAQEFARFHGKKVLYLSLEEVESTGKFAMSDGCTKNIGEFLYRLLGKHICVSRKADDHSGTEEGKMPFPDSYLVRNAFGVEAFAPARGKNPLRYLSEDNMQRFIAAMMDSGRYDVILMDLSGCLTDAGIAAMKMAEKICFISDNAGHSLREENYLSQVIYCGGEKVINRTMKVINRYASPGDVQTSEEDDEMVPVKAYIRRASNGHILQRPDAALDGDYGGDISHLTGILME